MRYLILILLISSCSTLKEGRDKKKFDELLQQYPEWKQTDTVFKPMEFETPAVKDSADLKDSAGTKEIIKIINKSDCPEKDKEIIRETIYKYRDKKIDTTIVTADGKFIFKNGRVFYEKPAGKITADVPVQETTIQPSGNSGKFDIGLGGWILIIVLALCLLVYLIKK